MNRREFNVSLATLLVPATVSPLLPAGRTPDQTEELRASVRWVEDKSTACYSWWQLRLGFTDPAPMFASLFQYNRADPDSVWTIRLGQMERQLPTGISVANAKKLAEFQVIEWTKMLLVELEKMAYC